MGLGSFVDHADPVLKAKTRDSIYLGPSLLNFSKIQGLHFHSIKICAKSAMFRSASTPQIVHKDSVGRTTVRNLC